MFGTPLEVPVFKQRDGAGLTFSDRRRARLDEAQLRGELATKVNFLSAGSHTDELSLTGRKSEDRSESRFKTNSHNSGLMSRCTMLILCKYCTARMIWWKQWAASVSEKCPRLNFSELAACKRTSKMHITSRFS